MPVKIIDEDGTELRWNNECSSCEKRQNCDYKNIQNHICLNRSRSTNT